ncbi:hypothetical protein PINS_up002611 [Pythium insidiosum]|nr:hypothetical protein PINS_up002611 [Pythium insidiosum]
MEEKELATQHDDATKIHVIRSAIDAKLRDDTVYQQIRELIAAKAAGRPAPEPTIDGSDTATSQLEYPEDRLIQDVLQSEIVQHLLQSVRLEAEAKDDNVKQRCTDTDVEQHPEASEAPAPVLYVRLAGGRAFVDQLRGEAGEQEEDVGMAPLSSRQIGSVHDVFRLVFSFQQQRVSSRDVPASVDPAFDEHLRFMIRKPRTRSGRTRRGGLYEVDVVAPWEALCLVDEPLHIVLLKVRKRLLDVHPSTGAVWEELQRDLVATHRVDWRRSLASTLSLVHLPVQLTDRMKVPVGTLDLRLDVLHVKRSAAVARDALAFLNGEAMERNTLTHTFHRHAKQWWDEYKSEVDAVDHNSTQISRESERSSHRGGHASSPCSSMTRRKPRLVKVFAEDTEGRFRMVCKYLTPLRAPLAIRSPSEAARFVALLPLERASAVGTSTAAESWRTLNCTLAVGKGDVVDHAVR